MTSCSRTFLVANCARLASCSLREPTSSWSRSLCRLLRRRGGRWSRCVCTSCCRRFIDRGRELRRAITTCVAAVFGHVGRGTSIPSYDLAQFCAVDHRCVRRLASPTFEVHRGRGRRRPSAWPRRAASLVARPAPSSIDGTGRSAARRRPASTSTLALDVGDLRGRVRATWRGRARPVGGARWRDAESAAASSLAGLADRILQSRRRGPGRTFGRTRGAEGRRTAPGRPSRGREGLDGPDTASLNISSIVGNSHVDTAGEQSPSRANPAGSAIPDYQASRKRRRPIIEPMTPIPAPMNSTRMPMPIASAFVT